jgi:DNA-binding transcriptional LysR family regulator
MPRRRCVRRRIAGGGPRFCITTSQQGEFVFDWNDLKHFLAVARHGSTLAGSRALGVDQSTVQRRLTELEKRLGQALVKRHPTGYRLTAFGETMLPHAERIDGAIVAFEQAVAAARDDGSGVVRVTCPEPIVKRLVQSGLLERFRARHPGLQVDFVISDRYVDLLKGEADIALRSGDTDDGELIGRKIGDSYWAVYGSVQYLEQNGRPTTVADLERHALVGLDESMANHRAAVWLRSVAPCGRVVARNSSVLGLVYAAKAGLGLAPLPTAIADAESDLERVLGPIDELTRIWRVLAAPDKRHAPRVAAFFDFVVDEIESLRPIITG